MRIAILVTFCDKERGVARLEQLLIIQDKNKTNP